MESPTTEAATEENNDELKTLIVQDIRNCRDALKFTRVQWQKMKEYENSVFEGEKNGLDEAHERIKQQECIFNETSKLLKTLPTNHSVQLVHNALLLEQKKEALLIEESFNAIKMIKVKLREENSRRAQNSRAAFEREIRRLETMIGNLQQIAEMAGIFLDDTIIVEQTTFGYANPGENFQPSRPALISPAAWLSRLDAILAGAKISGRPADVHATSAVQRHSFGTGMYQRVEKDLRRPVASRVNLKKNEHPVSDSVHEETPSGLSAPVRPNTPRPDPERETMGDWMIGFVEQGQNIMCEVEQRYELDIDAANRQYDRDERAIEIGLKKNEEQYSRALRLKNIMELLWETEYTDEWNEGRKIIKEELKLIRQERKELTNRQPRCEEHRVRRQNEANALLEKQSRFYKALVGRVESEAASLNQNLGDLN
ncbi:hypothetical protein COCMIDRAFT_3674 [Bipolaris oryzae ATCC 44560]|uniref:Uncharacterized protein n=1 Tax=Bipolaris oryzae ATCC 44560 TaxID=930090 RepID=W6Z6R6_COCMI|nr:uncharacterized protein COCMIDRAFT_3674 [Bipolaris oryzae ATCC 44560]EUC47422.1 hypothetical protein COCMIDRAFT_3674 [Bipolaris oryzae ATCC 44560]